MAKGQARTAAVLKKHGSELLAEWLEQLQSDGSSRDSRISEAELTAQAKEFLQLLQQAAHGGESSDLNRPEWGEMTGFLEGISRSRAVQGFTSDQTATFIFSLKKPLFARLRTEFGRDPEALADETWLTTELLDKLGLLTIRAFQKAREDVISRQQEELLELSTPVIKLWDGVLALPMIGTLDSSRTQIVMESLLQKLVETGSEMAIIDITGVPNGRYSCGPAFAQDSGGNPLDGGRLHY